LNFLKALAQFVFPKEENRKMTDMLFLSILFTKVKNYLAPNAIIVVQDTILHIVKPFQMLLRIRVVLIIKRSS
jgi:hypothetical protein